MSSDYRRRRTFLDKAILAKSIYREFWSFRCDYNDHMFIPITCFLILRHWDKETLLQEFVASLRSARYFISSRQKFVQFRNFDLTFKLRIRFEILHVFRRKQLFLTLQKELENSPNFRSLILDSPFTNDSFLNVRKHQVDSPENGLRVYSNFVSCWLRFFRA